MITQIAKELSDSHNLVALLRHHAGLEELGDTITEGADNNISLITELYRQIQYSKKKTGDKVKRSNGEPCCLEDLFGFMFGEMLNNIAFGKGNPSLVGKITKAIKADQVDIRGKLYRLAVNRELFPRSLMKLIGPKSPLNKVPTLIKNIRPEHFTENVLNDYQSFILNIKLEGEKAFNEIIESHLRLVVNTTQQFVTRDISLPFDDLIQEGSIGLIRAAESYNPAYGIRFMAFASLPIYQIIDRAIADKARIIRIPVHMVEAINQLIHTNNRLVQRYERQPTAKEIAIEMEMSSDRVREVLQFSQLPISLESLILEEEDDYFNEERKGSVVEYLIDENAESLDEECAKEFLKEQIRDVLDTLTFPERRVIELRFGLVDGQERTLEEVGKEFERTRERIRQIQEKALRKLRHPSRSMKLRDYLE